MSFVKIKQQLKSKFQSISSIQEVADYPTEEFNGFPAVMISSARNEAEFETTVHNERAYVFNVFILQKVYENIDEKKARDIIDSVVDDVIEALDKDQQLTGIDLPSSETMIISFPILSEIRNEPPYIVAELEVKVKISFNIT